MRENPFRTPSTIKVKSSEQRFASSFPLMFPQTYSTGFRSGAYDGRRAMFSHLRCPCKYWVIRRLRCDGRPSQTRMTFLPLNSPRISERKTINFSSLKESDTIWKNSRVRLPWQSKARAEQTESFFQLKQCRRTGVFPRGAHILRTGGFCEMPLSSRKTIQQWCFWAFFLHAPRWFSSTQGSSPHLALWRARSDVADSTPSCARVSIHDQGDS